MKIAVVGSSGYIAGFLLNRLAQEEKVENVLKIDQNDEADEFLDLQMPEKFNYDCLKEIDFVVFTAAVSGPDKCANEFEFCWNINVIGTDYFIRQAINRGCKVLFFSSDAVFGEAPVSIFNELAETNSFTPYGKMKESIEQNFRIEKNFKSLRLSYVVSVKDRFVSYCLECMEKNQIADVFHPFYRNCIVVSDVVNVVCWMIFHWEQYKPNVLNIAGKELVSRVRIADELNRYFGNRLRYHIVHPGEAFFKNRPSITQMESIYMEQYHILPDNTFTEKIKRELEETYYEL